MTAAKEATAPWRVVRLLALELSWISVVALPDQEQAADDEDQVAAGELLARRP